MDGRYVAARRGASPSPFTLAVAAPTPAPAPASACAPALPPPAAVGARDATGFGPLERFVVEPGVTDIFINGPNDLWVDRGSGLAHVPDWSCPSESHLRELAVRLIALGGRHIDEATPCVDVRIGDGIRLHAVLPPVSPHGTLVSVRLPRMGFLKFDDLDRGGFFAESDGSETAYRSVIETAVCERSNVLVTGAGGSGKTTFLSALLSSAPADERIVAIEDVAELRVEHPHFVSLEARQPNLEGAGGISLERLLREALRMRPDRLVLGECRGAEIRELLSALNTGHDGGAGTLHANSLADVPARLEALGTLAGLGPEAIARQTVSAINLIVHIERRGPYRRLAGLGVFALDGRGRLEVREHATGLLATRDAAANPPAARATGVAAGKHA
ncbi:TadA family conjugal transfer-associated ATPase [Subtercola boreus]|uniref:TadA family conjugal transfer-associated ATPase n=1 Tax=Subtercola boreus TaxID=120213 RepID=UPI003F58B4F5